MYSLDCTAYKLEETCKLYSTLYTAYVQSRLYSLEVRRNPTFSSILSLTSACCFPSRSLEKI